MQNTSVVLQYKPTHKYPEVDEGIFEVRQGEINPEQLKQNEVLVQVLFASVDAAMRIWITGVKTYFDPVRPGDVMPALGVGRVIESRSERFQKGDYVSGLMRWQQYVVLPERGLSRVGSGNLNEAELMAFIGPLGISGLTAWTGLEFIGKPQPGEVVVVSAAGGAVGEMAVQLAKNHYKCKVIGIAGGVDKCKYVVEQLGADACVDYKSENVEKRLKELVPNGLDIYFDNVGGEILDAALMNIKECSRIVLCGAISQYNEQRKDQYRLVNYARLIIKKGIMQGFIYTDYSKNFKDGVQVLGSLLKDGKLKVRYDIQDGLQSAPKGLQKLLLGKNNGKVIVKVQQQQPKL